MSETERRIRGMRWAPRDWLRPRVPPPALPLPNCYWVTPGRLLAGEHPYGAAEADARDRLGRLFDAGIDCFVDLTEALEMPDYRPLLPAGVRYLRSPIIDTCVPAEPAQMRALQSFLRDSLAAERRLYVHCRAGIGRTGLVVGCHLVETGLGGKAAMKRLNRLWLQSARCKSWPKLPQTPQQADYILRWSQHRAG
jgi:hypothetical protein